MSEDLNFVEVSEDRDEVMGWVGATEAGMQEEDAIDVTTVAVPHPLEALDSAILKARALHLDTSTDQGVALRRVRDDLLAALDEVRALFKGLLP